TPKDVAGIVKMVPTTLYLVNPFFVDIGLLQRAEGGFLPAPEVVNYQLAFQWSPESASQKLAPLIEKTWFAQKLMPKLRFRVTEEKEAVTDLAMAASAGTKY